MEIARAKLRTVRGCLDEWVFPPASPSLGTLRGWEYALVLAAVLALAAVAELARPGFSGSVGTLWAEDGIVFLRGALTHSFGDQIFTVYPEYLVVVPRLIAEVATPFPLRNAAAIISIVSAVGIALSGLAVWFASAGHIRNPYLRATLALLTVLAPVAGLEAVASASYVSWYMLAATFWLLLYRPATMRATLLSSLFVLLTALSNPGVWFFLPVVGLRTLAIRNRRDLAIVAAYAVGSIAQAITSIEHPSEFPAGWSHDIWTVYLQRVLDGAVLGLRWGGDLWAALGWPLLIGLLVLAVTGFALGFRLAGPRARCLGAIAIALSLLIFVVSMYQRSAAPVLLWPEGTHLEIGGRYAILPALLLVGAALALVDDSLHRRGETRSFSPAAAIAVVVLLVTTGSSFYLRESVARGEPPWTDALDSARAACASKPLKGVKIRTSPPGFGVILPCDVVTSDAVAEPAPNPR